MKIVDITQTFTDAMPVFPGDPPATLKQTVSIETAGNNDHEFRTNMHVGTHMDAPFHMLQNGKMIDEINVKHFIGRGVLIDARGKKEIGEELMKNISVQEGDIVLIMTGFGEKFGDEAYFSDYPTITQEFARHLVAKKIALIGMDSASPEHNPPWEIHKTFLSNNIFILENLTNLEKLERVASFEVIALPMKLRADGAPARVIAKIL